MTLPSCERVLAAMSGGVDSSVAAAIMVARGHRVTGLTLSLWSCDLDPTASDLRGRSCCGGADTSAAREAARSLGIPHVVLDSRGHFLEDVVWRARDDQAAGLTPNPCILCNERIKFGFLLEWALGNCFTMLVTGHHARVDRGHPPAGPALLRGMDASKDQSYVLYTLAGDRRLDSIDFPVGAMTKREVREHARAIGLPNADKPDSQDLCFPKADRERDRPGRVVDLEGREVGTHRGISRVTVGQRRGLRVGGSGRLYVVAIHADRNEIVVGGLDDLLATRVHAVPVAWSGPLPGPEGVAVDARIRYRQDAAPGRARTEGGRLVVDMERPVRAVTPGQALVCYDGDRVLGGGTIVLDQPGRSISTSGGTRK